MLDALIHISLAMRWFHHLFFLSLSHCPEIIRVHLLNKAGLQVGYHHFELFRQSTIEVVMRQLGYVVRRKTFWE